MNTQNALAATGSVRENKLDLVERLADDLAHEIKNPLHSIVINLEVLRRKISRLDNAPVDDLMKYADVLNAEVDRLSERVDLLLRMVRPESASDEPVPISEILDELAPIVQLECARQQIELNRDLPEIIPRPRLGRDLARQMLLSVFLAAMDEIKPGGTLSVTSESTNDHFSLKFELFGDHSEQSHAGDTYLSVASSLAQHLEGRLEASSNGAKAPAEGGRREFVITLPTDR